MGILPVRLWYWPSSLDSETRHLPLSPWGCTGNSVPGGQQTHRSTARALLLKTETIRGWRVWVGVPGLEETTYTGNETRPPGWF